jgi:hypothetical protein
MRVGMMNYINALSTDDLVELVHGAELARLEGNALLKRVDGALKGESLRYWQLRPCETCRHRRTEYVLFHGYQCVDCGERHR